MGDFLNSIVKISKEKLAKNKVYKNKLDEINNYIKNAATNNYTYFNIHFTECDNTSDDIVINNAGSCSCNCNYGPNMKYFKEYLHDFYKKEGFNITLISNVIHINWESYLKSEEGLNYDN